MPADDADNLLFLLAHCFNAFCAYVLIHHLIKDKWIALFGAVIVGLSVPNTDGSSLPSMYVIGTLPLTFYFIHRAVTENQWRLALLAGLCAGATTLISMNVFAFLLLTVAIYIFVLAVSRLRQIAFWRQIMLFICVCASISAFRIVPMVADEALRSVGLARHQGIDYSFDLLDFFVRSDNPFFGPFLHAAYDVAPDSRHRRAYLGIHQFILHWLRADPRRCPRGKRRKRLLPWLAILVFCAIYRLGHFPTINAVRHTDVVLPAARLKRLVSQSVWDNQTVVFPDRTGYASGSPGMLWPRHALAIVASADPRNRSAARHAYTRGRILYSAQRQNTRTGQAGLYRLAAVRTG